jgi:integrase
MLAEVPLCRSSDIRNDGERWRISPSYGTESRVKTVQARLGHASAAETLDTYSHLWPDSDDRTRAAVDSVLGRVADSVRTDVRP